MMRRYSAVILVIAVLLGSSLAHAYKVIDEFDTPNVKYTINSTTDLPFTATHTGNSSQMVGGVRDLMATRANMNNPQAAQLQIEIGNSTLLASGTNVQCAPHIKLTYDGTSGGTGSFSSQDMTEGGLANGYTFKFDYASKHPNWTSFVIRVVEDGVTYTYDATSDANTWFTNNLTDLQASTSQEFHVLFSNFGGGSDMDNVTWIEVEMVASTRKLDYTLDWIRATPEPGTIILGGLAVLLGGFLRRRFRKQPEKV